uniref:Uncharacterized protein n=1 Tax=Leersia perrieri TaxID=77586 RepID=A0A0D9WQT7_9ORYZ
MNGATGGAGGSAARRLSAVSLPRAQWRLADERCELREEEMEYMRRFHRHNQGGNQCTSFVAKHVRAPLQTVWSLVRRFDQPQLFKPFVRKCVMQGKIETGCVREVTVQSGLPATRSIERLELLDDNEHILRVKFIGGDHMLKNYSSILSVHSEVIDGQQGTLVIESFVVDIPEGNNQDDICYFVENMLKCNLRTLADVSEEHLARSAARRLSAVSLPRAQWRLADERCELREEMEYMRRFHRHNQGGNQCTSFVAKYVRDPLQTARVTVQSGLPATRSIERLELLDDNEHILRVKFIGGDHMLKNYSSILSVHSEVIDGQPGTLVIESFVVDIPEGNNQDDICYFIENMLKCNLRTLADMSEERLSSS